MRGKLKYFIKLFIAIIVFTVSYITGKKYSELYYYTVMFICPLSVVYLLIQLWKMLCELVSFRKIIKKYAPRLFSILEKGMKLWGRFTNRILEMAKSTAVYHKYEMLKLKDLSRITGYSDEKLTNFSYKTSKDYDLILKKWRKCKGNAEKVRYIYGKYIERERKEGKVFDLVSTPYELIERWDKTDYNQLLADTYYKARYNENEQIEDEIVKRLQG